MSSRIAIDQTSRNVICSVVFVDLVEYTRKSVAEQLAIKDHFTAVVAEALYLAARYVFDDLGYRRFEWKCNDLNEPSKRAARRFGFAFEGVFRQHMWVKGANRDTAWFAMLDQDWPRLRAAYERWLEPSNFDAAARQRAPLAARRGPCASAGRLSVN